MNLVEVPPLATNPMWEWLAKLINAAPDPPFRKRDGTPLLSTPRYYRGKAEPGAVVGYFLFGSAPALPVRFYSGQAGWEGRFTVHCWADTVPNASRLADWLVGLLSGAALEVAGFTASEFAVSTGSDAPDPDEEAHQVPLYIDAELLAAA